MNETGSSARTLMAAAMAAALCWGTSAEESTSPGDDAARAAIEEVIVSAQRVHPGGADA